MGDAVGRLEQGDHVLSVECLEPEGPVVRHVDLLSLSFQNLRALWENLKQFEMLFNMPFEDDFGWFVQRFLKQVGPDQFEPTGIFWQVDDVGLFYLTEIRPEYEALAHFTFWDGRFRGREELTKEMVRYSFEQLRLHRLVAEIPLCAPAALDFAERVGFVKEGRKRKSHWLREQWYDANLYSILDSEVEE